MYENAITYENQNGRKINGIRRWGIDVRLAGKIIGDIRSDRNGWFYKPTDRRPGETFESIEAVKKSLEAL